MFDTKNLNQDFNAPLINLSIDTGDWGTENLWQALSEQAVIAACQVLEEDYLHYEISLMLADDAVLQDLNRTWRGKDRPTNVLSFEAFLPAELVASESNILPLGDIALSYETLAREAKLDNKAFEHHFSHLVVHGFLHLLGYDHEEAAMADQMENLERSILAKLSIPDPYGEAPLA